MLRVAIRPIKVGEEMRQIGDPVPEAEDWLNLKSYLETGMLVRDDSEAPISPGGAGKPDSGQSDRSSPSQPPMMRRRSR